MLSITNLYTPHPRALRALR